MWYFFYIVKLNIAGMLTAESIFYDSNYARTVSRKMPPAKMPSGKLPSEISVPENYSPENCPQEKCSQESCSQDICDLKIRFTTFSLLLILP